jgi:hypothetical protein
MHPKIDPLRAAWVAGDQGAALRIAARFSTARADGMRPVTRISIASSGAIRRRSPPRLSPLSPENSKLP